MRPVCCGKGVIDIEIAHLRERRSKLGIVLFLARVEAHILEQHDLSRSERGDCRFRRLAHTIVRKRNVSAQELAERTRHRRQAHRRRPLALWPIEVRQ